MDFSEFKKQNEGKPKTVEEENKGPEVTDKNQVITEDDPGNDAWMHDEEPETETVVEEEPEQKEKKDQIPLKKYMIQKGKIEGIGIRDI